MSVDALADGSAKDIAVRLGQCLHEGAVLDLQGSTIAAELLRSALLGKPPAGQPEPVASLVDVDPRGLLITNADIQGHLDLRNATISSAVTITNSTISVGIDLSGARLSHGLDLTDSTVSTLDLASAAITGSLRLSAVRFTGTDQDGNSLVANNLQVDSGAFLDQGFNAAGAVRLMGARITGLLDMGGAQLSTNQDSDSLVADGLQVDGDAFLDQGFTAAGAVRLGGAHITGQLNMRGAQLTGQDGDSLVADNLQVGGDAFLDRSFNAAGAVRLMGARITGQLNMRGAELSGTDQDGDSLVADGLQVDGSAFLDQGFTAAGAVRLGGARITGQLSMGGAQLTGTDQADNSLVADNLQVDGSAFLDQGFTAAGAVRLHSAHIIRELGMRDAQLTGTNHDGYSLVADNLQVDGAALLDRGFAVGAIKVMGAHIIGQLSMRGAQLTGTDQDGDSLVADGLQVDGSAFLDQGFTAAGAVHLTGARITGQLRMNATSIGRAAVGSPGLNMSGAAIDGLRIDLHDVDWIDRSKVRPDPPSLPPPRVVLSLENCTYKHRPDPTLGSLETWLRVLRFHTPDYQPRAYQNLAAAHRATGHDRDAGRILMAQQDHRRATALRPQPNTRLLHRIGLWTTRTGLAIWKATLGYGYRPRRALAWLLILLATAGLLVTVAAHWQADPTVPDVPVAYRPANKDTGTPAGYCSGGEAAGLAVRIAIPLVTNLGQGACIINTATTPGSAIVAVSIGLQTFAWILGGLTIAAAATAIKRSP